MHATIWLQHPQFANTRFLMPLEFLSQLCVKLLVEQTQQRGRTCCHLFGGAVFSCNELVVYPQFASPAVLSGPLAIQVFKRPMEAGGGEFAELGCEKLL